MSDVISITVLGKPEPRGSKIAVPLYDQIPGPDGTPLINPKNGKPYQTPRLNDSGRPMSFMRDDNSASGPWMKRVAAAAKRAMGARRPILEPVLLTLDFYLERPLYHFGTGRNAGTLKDRHRNQHHIVRPDRLKLARAIEDALTEIVYGDDSQTVDGPVRKHYVTPGEQPRVEIVVEVLCAAETVTQLSLVEQFQEAEAEAVR